MRKHLILLMVFMWGLFYSQNKNLSFKDISFTQKDSIINLEEYRKGQEKAMVKFESEMGLLMDGLFESLGGKARTKAIDKKKSDSIINSLSQKDLDNSIIVYHYKNVDKNIWKLWETKENNDILKYPVFTDFSKGKEYYEHPYNGIQEYSYIFERIKDLKIQEFRKEKKKISEIQCFKIKCSYSQIFKHRKIDGMPEFPDKIELMESEMWVTEEIRSTYHPAFKVKEILEKYYPLYIKQRSSLVPGMIRKIALHDFH